MFKHSSSFCLLLIAAGQTNIPPTAHRDVGTMDRRDEHLTAGKLVQFETLQPFLSLDRDSANYVEAAQQMKTTEAAARVAAHRLRKRYRALLRDEIAHTVATPEEVDDEIRHLFEVLGGDGFRR